MCLLHSALVTADTHPQQPAGSLLMSCHCRSSSPCVFLLPAGLLSGGSLPTEQTPMGCGLGSLASVPALSLSQGSMGRQRPAGGSLGSGGGLQQRQPSGSGGGGMQRQLSGGSWGMGGGGEPPVGPLASWGGGGPRGSKRARSQCSGDGDEAVQRAAVSAVHHIPPFQSQCPPSLCICALAINPSAQPRTLFRPLDCLHSLPPCLSAVLA